MNYTKFFLTSSFKVLRACISSKAKVTNHYDVLNVSKNSTQEEIKAAYYELTKQYHPDRNTTKEAKQKFQDVSNAYEVLGNFHKRKLYDRNLTARGAEASKNINYTWAEDNVDELRKSRQKVHTNSNTHYRNYDFDAWSKAHYGYTLQKQLDKQKFIRERRAMNLRQKIQDEKEYKDTRLFVIIFIFLISCGMTFQSFALDYDNPVIKKK